ncbi:MAG: response regulator, partial [Candidatus Omnitrophica bacterium]|nr:response regulator [Candidatus Omnitrophota bacterium]
MSSNLKNFRILIVDDEPLIRQSLCEILRIDGYKVQMAASAEEAQEIIAQQSIDVVVTDLKLPKLSGVELLKWSKEKYPAVEFILITGYGCVETAVEAMKEGAFEYITKPINDEEIKILIRNIVDKKNILSENQALKEEL